MASGCIMPSAGGKPQTDVMLVDKLPEEINEMKIRDDKAEKVGLGRGLHILVSSSMYIWFILGSFTCDRKWKQL